MLYLYHYLPYLIIYIFINEPIHSCIYCDIFYELRVVYKIVTLAAVDFDTDMVYSIVEYCVTLLSALYFHVYFHFVTFLPIKSWHTYMIFDIGMNRNRFYQNLTPLSSRWFHWTFKTPGILSWIYRQSTSNRLGNKLQATTRYNK